MEGRRERERVARVEARVGFLGGKGVVGVWYWYVNFLSLLTILNLFGCGGKGTRSPLSPRVPFLFSPFLEEKKLISMIQSVQPTCGCGLLRDAGPRARGVCGKGVSDYGDHECV
jgi:hypothetical protein